MKFFLFVIFFVISQTATSVASSTLRYTCFPKDKVSRIYNIEIDARKKILYTDLNFVGTLKTEGMYADFLDLVSNDSKITKFYDGFSLELEVTNSLLKANEKIQDPRTGKQVVGGTVVAVLNWLKNPSNSGPVRRTADCVISY